MSGNEIEAIEEERERRYEELEAAKERLVRAEASYRALGEEQFYGPPGSPKLPSGPMLVPAARAATDRVPIFPGETNYHGITLPPPPTASPSHRIADTSPLHHPEGELEEVKQRLRETRIAEREREDLRGRLAKAEDNIRAASAQESENEALKQRVQQLEGELYEAVTEHGQDSYWIKRVGFLQIRIDDLHAENEVLKQRNQRLMDDVYAGEEPDTKLAYRIKEIEADNRRLRKMLEIERQRVGSVDALQASRAYLDGLAEVFGHQIAAQREAFRSAELALLGAAGNTSLTAGPPQVAGDPGVREQEGYWCARCRLFVREEERGKEPPKQVAQRLADRSGQAATTFFGEVPGYGALPPPPNEKTPVRTSQQFGLSPDSPGLTRAPPEHPAASQRPGGSSAHRNRLARLQQVGTQSPAGADRVELSHWSPGRKGLVSEFPVGWGGKQKRSSPRRNPNPEPRAVDPHFVDSPAFASPQSVPPPAASASGFGPSNSAFTPSSFSSESANLPAAVAVYTPQGWRQL
eukprot:Hpha_TRINITY_DN20217_c0_g1::TRINITY_DN20217_c0_g1_i1::g.168334::m.168334